MQSDALKQLLSEVRACTVHDPAIVALVPLGFGYPGSAPSGDKPPRPECAPLRRERILDHLREDRLEIIIGTYARERDIPDRKRR